MLELRLLFRDEYDDKGGVDGLVCCCQLRVSGAEQEAGKPATKGTMQPKTRYPRISTAGDAFGTIP